MSIASQSTGTENGGCGVPKEELALRMLVRADQLAAIRQSIAVAIPVNAVVGLAALLVSHQHGRSQEGIAWFSASVLVNVLRIVLTRKPGAVRPGGDGHGRGPGRADAVDGCLRLAAWGGLLSGIVWACLPLLCDGFTSAQTTFFLAITCGITAGAVTYGTSYARIPIAFISPPLLTTVLCLLAIGGFDKLCLAATVVVYWGALTRASLQGERTFREASRLKHEATELARSLETAHDQALAVAAEMSHRASHDPLTGLLNRSGLMDSLEAARPDPAMAGHLLLIDLDGFKSINDAFGHKVGDRVLREVADRLRRSLPADAAAARFGGDEFAVLLPGDRKTGAVLALADRLIGAIREPFGTLEAGRLGAGIGICRLGETSLPELMICADEALCAAKSAGRGQACLFDAELRSRLAMRRDGERDLPRAIAERSLAVWFQPIFGDGGRALSGFEALLRWQHPRHGWIAPGEIVAFAARAGQSEPLLRFILSEACRMIARTDGAGLRDLGVSVNVSPRELAHLPVDEIVLSELAAAGVAPERLAIEITEEAALDPAAVEGKLGRLSAAGIRLAIDDFGIGYSSLASLRHLRPDRLKIDRTFVTGLSGSGDDRLLVAAILGLGRSMGFEVVAEGVETADDLLALQALGCRYMQGYGLGRPMPAADVLDWKSGLSSAAA